MITAVSNSSTIVSIVRIGGHVDKDVVINVIQTGSSLIIVVVVVGGGGGSDG